MTPAVSTPRRRARRPLLGYNGTEGDPATYSGYIFTDRVVRLIEAHAANTAPLFIYWALHNTHAPIEAPQRFLDLYPQHKDDKTRQTFSGMVSVVDESVANVTRALKATGAWARTLLVWSTDNGSPVPPRPPPARPQPPLPPPPPPLPPPPLRASHPA